MLGWQCVLRSLVGRAWLLAVLAASGCWSDDPLIDGAFTAEQWARLKVDFAPPQTPDFCALPASELAWVPGTFDAARCELAARLGQELFWEPKLSGGTPQLSCFSCHNSRAWFIDTRGGLPSVSPPASGKAGKRNSLSMVNLALKSDLAPKDDADGTAHHIFTWSGGTCFNPDKNNVCAPAQQYDTIGGVTELALSKAMASADELGSPKLPVRFDAIHSRASSVIVQDAHYSDEFQRIFNTPASAMTPDEVTTRLQLPIEAYLRRLVSIDSSFDKYMLGDQNAISDSAKRGFAVFVGRGTCAECHSGPMFSDFRFHNTGVDGKAPAPQTDPGRGEVVMDAAANGRFVTPSLRHVAQTAPYMHDGAIASLNDVIWFYRNGGNPTGYAGTRDPRILPLSLTDADAVDLEAFLLTLTGNPVSDPLQSDIRPGVMP
jgi:cytochrome c peroxidase